MLRETFLASDVCLLVINAGTATLARGMPDVYLPPRGILTPPRSVQTNGFAVASCKAKQPPHRALVRLDTVGVYGPVAVRQSERLS
jgi:hypothetical protein